MEADATSATSATKERSSMFMRAVAMRVCNGVTFDANIGLWGSMALSVSGTINGTTIIRDRGFWMDAVAAAAERAG